MTAADFAEIAKSDLAFPSSRDSNLLGWAGDQDWDRQAVADLVNSFAEEQVPDRPVALRADDEQVDQLFQKRRHLTF